MQNENDFFEVLGLTYKKFKINNYNGVIFYNESFIGYLTKNLKIEIENKIIYKEIIINKVTTDYIEGSIKNLNNSKINYSFDTNNKAYRIENENNYVTFIDGTLIKNSNIKFIDELSNEFPVLLNNINEIERKK